jgi:protein disulfide-isomerase A6
MLFFSKFTFLLAVFARVNGLYDFKNSKVIKLTGNNFDKEVLKSDEIWFVEFYAEWCGHCKKLAPDWEKAAKALKGVVKFGAIECSDEKNGPMC